MSFESRRLRVQLPCGDGTVLQDATAFICPMDTRCRLPSFFCDPETCVFGEASEVGPKGLCHNYATCNFRTCDYGSCPEGSIYDARCRAGTDEPIDPRALLIDPEHLPVLRKALEARLDEVKEAQEALEKFG